MSSTTRTPTADDRTAYVTAQLKLYKAFHKADAAELTGALEALAAKARASLTPTELTQTNAYSEFQKELNDAVKEVVDELMVRRLVSNHRKVPLLSERDTEGLINEIMEGEVVSKESATAEAMLRPLVKRYITAVLLSLSLYDNNDPYQGFWNVIAAITAETTSALTPHQIIDHPVARASVYQRVVKRRVWRRQKERVARFLSGVTVSDTLKDAVSLEEDELALRLEAELAQADEMNKPYLEAVIKAVRQYYNDRERSIFGSASAR